MEYLPAQALPAVPHISFGIFNLAIPNIIAWGLVIGIFILILYARIPRIFEQDSAAAEKELRHESHT